MASGPGRTMSEPFPPEGLPLEAARRRVLAAVQPLAESEPVSLAAALGRVSAAAVHATTAVPGFRASVMDGYAVVEGDPPPVGSRWVLVGRSAAGTPFPGRVGPGQAVRILTGAALPEGAHRVLPQELLACTDAADGTPPTLELTSAAGANRWIRAADEEAAAGAELLPAGVRLGPADLARLAGCGVDALQVRRRPRLGLLVSGDELVPPGTARAAGQIWESNGLLLSSLLRRLGQEVADLRVVRDDPDVLRPALAALARDCDVVVSTGGVSVGDGDWIRPLLAELGRVEFWKLFLRPGRPFAFGAIAGRPFFGLPGNPVSAAITALQLLWPALEHLEGVVEPPGLPRLRVRLATGVERRPGRPELARARLESTPEGLPLARLEGSQASSRIGSLQGADLLVEIPAEAERLEAGCELWAQLLRVPLF